MYIHPRYAELTGHSPPGFTSPPEPPGTTLATFERNQGAERLRVSSEEYQGHPFVRLAVWSRNPDTGHWWPMKGKSVSIRMRELPELVDALAGLVGGQDVGEDPSAHDRASVPAATSSKPRREPGRDGAQQTEPASGDYPHANRLDPPTVSKTRERSNGEAGGYRAVPDDDGAFSEF